MRNNPDITCLCEDPGLEDDPGFWLARVKSAAGSPLEVLKSDGDKVTLKARLEPWGEVCLQEKKWRGMKKRLSLIRRTSGRAVWDLASVFTDLDIPVVEQLLYLEIRENGFVSHTFQVSRWLEGYNLGEMAGGSKGKSESFLPDILEKAALVIARLHGAGFIHGDLKWTNFLYVPGSSKEVVLTDLDHVRQSTSPGDMGRDLARFILAAAEFNMPGEVEERLISVYLQAFQGNSKKVEDKLTGHLVRKRGRYENRRLEAPGTGMD